MKALGAVCAAATVAGCASFGGRASTSSRADLASVADSLRPPVIQVRSYPAASTISVLGWTPDEAAYGLRSEVRRDGSIVGSGDRTEHRLYVSSFYVIARGGFSAASIGEVPPGRVLRTSSARDENACNRTLTCAPMYTVNVQVPDAVLREQRDSVVVSFYNLKGNDWKLTLHRDLIDGYLRAVDSVAVARRRN